MCSFYDYIKALQYINRAPSWLDLTTAQGACCLQVHSHQPVATPFANLVGWMAVENNRRFEGIHTDSTLFILVGALGDVNCLEATTTQRRIKNLVKERQCETTILDIKGRDLVVDNVDRVSIMLPGSLHNPPGACGIVGCTYSGKHAVHLLL
jgi:hypothetical protein